MKNGKSFVETYSQYDTILMDADACYEWRGIIRQSSRNWQRRIPVIAMTANAFSEDSLAAGMNAHISKPVEMEVLKKTIKSIKINGGAKIPISKLYRQDMEMRFVR